MKSIEYCTNIDSEINEKNPVNFWDVVLKLTRNSKEIILKTIEKLTKVDASFD